MASYRQIYYHIVFGTKGHKPTLPDEHCEELYKYIWGIIKNKSCKLYRIIEYIKNQKEHHRKETFFEEYKRLLKEYGIDYDEKYID